MPYRTQDNKIDGVVLALQDINAIRGANEQLKKSAEFFRGVMNTVLEPLLVLDVDLRIIMVNEPFLRTFKVSREETVDKFLYTLGNGQWNIPKLRTLLEDVLPKHQAVRGFAVEHNFESIGPRTILLNARTLASVPEAEAMILLAMEDVTESAQAEAALRESEEKYRTLFESIDEGFCIIEAVEGGTDTPLDFRYVAANRAFETQSGVAGVVGKTVRQVFPDESDEWFETYAAILKTGKQIRFERNFGAQGRVMDFYACRIEDERHRRVALIFKDITGRKEAELALARLAAIVECSDDAIIGKNLDGIIQTWNAGAERLFGYKQQEAIGQSVTLLIPPERAYEEPAILERLRRGEHIQHYEAVRRHKDGRLLHVSLTISPIINAHGQIVGASKIARDITERKFTEAALMKSEKLAAAGRLAATLAHEINNPLQAVTNLMSLLGQSPGLSTHERAYAAMAEEELGRVVHLTQQSLSFYRESIYPVAVNLDTVLDGVLNLYAKRIEAKKIVVAKEYFSDGTTINTYPGEVRQVFSTLLLNAMDAVLVSGTIAIRVRQSFHWNNPASHGIRVTIADSGIGIAPDNTARIFEPFFTTKGEQGTGLGLWVANGIISRLGGSIRMRSSVLPGKSGTCFSIFLPNKIPKHT